MTTMCLLVRGVSCFLILSLVNCSGKRSTEKSSYHPTYVYQVQNQVEKAVKKTYRMHCYSAGGSMPQDVEAVNIGFQRKKPATVDEARILMIEILQIFSEKINDHKEIRPFLREYPFPITRLHLGLSFDSRYPGSAEQGSVDHVFSARGKIFYSQLGKTFEDHVDLMVETYEEALQKYNDSKMKTMH